MNTNSDHSYIVNDWLIDLPSGSIIHQKTHEQKRLGEYQLKLLNILAAHAGEVLSRNKLNMLVWENRVIGNNSLPNAIHALRIALEDDGKEQKIIKTIPKRGYLLEKAFCIYQVQATDSNIFLSQASQSIVGTQIEQTASLQDNLPIQAAKALIAPTATTKQNLYFSPLFYLAILFCLIIAGASGYFITNSFQPVPSSYALIDKNEFSQLSQISIHQILEEWQENENYSEEIQNRLSDTLYDLNQLLIKHHAKMNVYYRSSEFTLNYTLVIENPCDRQELSMNIYHWRSDHQHLNNLIYRETARKLNGMSSCNI